MDLYGSPQDGRNGLYRYRQSAGWRSGAGADAERGSLVDGSTARSAARRSLAPGRTARPAGPRSPGPGPAARSAAAPRPGRPGTRPRPWPSGARLRTGGSRAGGRRGSRAGCRPRRGAAGAPRCFRTARRMLRRLPYSPRSCQSWPAQPTGTSALIPARAGRLATPGGTGEHRVNWRQHVVAPRVPRPVRSRWAPRATQSGRGGLDRAAPGASGAHT